MPGELNPSSMVAPVRLCWVACLVVLVGCATGSGTRSQVSGVRLAAPSDFDPAPSSNPGISSATDANQDPMSSNSLARSDQRIESNIEYVASLQPVTTDDVIAMTQAGVDEALIIQQIRTQGMAAAVKAKDLIRLQRTGVSTQVVAAMQENPPTRRAERVASRSHGTVVRRYHYYD